MITKKQAEELRDEGGAITFVLYLDNGDIQNAYDGFIMSVSGDRAVVNSENKFTLSVALEDIYLSDGAIIQNLIHHRQEINGSLSSKLNEADVLRRKLEENYKQLQEIL